MALELTMKRGKAPVYPTKTSINLAADSQSQKTPTRNIVLFVIALLAILVFAKFAVVDVLSAAASSSSKVAAAQNELAALKASNADFNDLQERYAAYAVNTLSAEEQALANRQDVLNMLEDSVANMANLQSMSISGNTILLQFSNTSLEDVSRVVESLESNNLVAGVAVSTAKTDKNDSVVSVVTVTLKSAGALASGAGTGA